MRIQTTFGGEHPHITQPRLIKLGSTVLHFWLKNALCLSSLFSPYLRTCCVMFGDGVFVITLLPVVVAFFAGVGWGGAFGGGAFNCFKWKPQEHH